MLEVKAGDSVQLTCEVKGKPVPEIIWYHNAVPATNLLTGPENGGKGLWCDPLVKGEGLYFYFSANHYSRFGYQNLDRIHLKENGCKPYLIVTFK